MKMYEFVIDRVGNKMFVGDYVACLVDDYTSIRRGERRRIQALIDGGRITLNNRSSPIGTSDYLASNFELVGRHHPYHREQKSMSISSEQQVLHVAFRIDDRSITELAVHITAYGRGESAVQSLNGRIMADTDLSSLKRRVREVIQARPEEKWVMISGNTIGETSAPPVVFRPY